MNRRIILFLVALMVTFTSMAQSEYVQQGEFGFSIGAAHYFGDLNTRAALNRPKPTVGAFFRKQFGNYIGMRISAHYAQLGYSDVYSKNEYQKTRNLSFNSNIWELAVQGDFNFFKFIPGDPDHQFTPYITLGIGLFAYDPYTYFNGKKEFLRPLGTEGQTAGLGIKEYGTMSMIIPFGVGIKYSVSEKTNVSFEICQRFTGTDYLDDVSTVYVGEDKFPAGPNGPSTAFYLQDRSYEIVAEENKLGKLPGRQRGWSKQKDQYVFAEIGISFNISTYKCPSTF